VRKKPNLKKLHGLCFYLYSIPGMTKLQNWMIHQCLPGTKPGGSNEAAVAIKKSTMKKKKGTMSDPSDGIILLTI